MGIPIWRPPTPASEPILSPSAAHRLAVHRRHRRPSARDRDRNTQAFVDYYRQSIGSTSSSQLWRELNTLPSTAVRRMPRPENEEEYLAAADEARRAPHPIVLPLPIPPEQRLHIRARMASVSAAMRRVQRRAEVSTENNDEEEESEATGDENMRPRPPPAAPTTRPFLRYMDGLGDRERSIRYSTSQDDRYFTS